MICKFNAWSSVMEKIYPNEKSWMQQGQLNNLVNDFAIAINSQSKLTLFKRKYID